MSDDRLPSPPAGFKALRCHDGTQDLWAVGATCQVTHLIVTQSEGTLCGLTLFARNGRRADIPGWSVGGGVFGPLVEQIRCDECYSQAGDKV